MISSTTPKCLLKALDRHANPRQQLFRTARGWEAISAHEMLRRVAGLARAMGGLGVHAGDRAAVFAPNCPEWHIADFAIAGLGAVTVPVYFKESAERAAYILNDSGTKLVFAAGVDQARLLDSIRPRLAALEHVIYAGPLEGLSRDCLRYEELLPSFREGDIADYRRGAAQVKPEQTATLIYTSGTTGEPKGVVLTHANLTSNALDGCGSYAFGPEHLGLSFLPLAHVFERTVDNGYLFHGTGVAYVEQIETAAQALAEVRPTHAAVVPRVLEKLYAAIVERGERETGLKRMLFDWSLGVARRAVPWKAYGRSVPFKTRFAWRVADKLVYAKIRAGVGGRIDSFISGGAPLAVELAEFLWSVGLSVYQGYGLTETSPVVSTNLPGANRVGTVGHPIPGVHVKIAEDGEVLVRGRCVMHGYYKKSQETRKAFTADGWLRTGDIGSLDAEGYLSITDRKKDLIKTAAGKFVAPQPIENLLKSSPFISSAAVVGDRRKFVVALVVPNFARLAAWRRQQGLGPSSPREMAGDARVHELIGAEIERLTSGMAQYEKLKRFALLPEDFSPAGGELTHTMKLKRRVIEEKYKDAIESLYAGVEEPRPQPQR